MEKLTMKEKEKYEIIKKWSEKTLTFQGAKSKLNYSTQHMYRLKKLYKEKGKDGFTHGNRGRQPAITINRSLSDNIVQYYQTEYQGYNFNHYKFALKKEKDIDVSYTKVYHELTIKNGILSPRAKKETRKKYKKQKLLEKYNKTMSEDDIDKMSKQMALEDATPSLPRPRYFGENIELDASSYVFFGDEKTTLHLSIDASTDVCTGGYLDKQETLNGYYNVLFQILTKYGIPMKFTTDGRTIFEYVSKKMKSDEKAYFTQFQHACNQLGIELKVTSKAQKKPRVEKYNDTFQDRLTNELHHNNITTIEAANEYLLNTFIPEFNELFAKEIRESDIVFEKLMGNEELNYILAVLSIRKFNNGNSINYKGKTYLPYDENNKMVFYRKGTECTVIEAFDKKLYTQVYNEVFILKELQGVLEKEETLEDYFHKEEKLEPNILPKAQSNWDKDRLDDNFAKINEKYKIYDSHNPKV